MRDHLRLLGKRYNQAIQNTEAFFEYQWKHRKLLVIFLVSLLVVFWNAPYIYTGGLIDRYPGDSDYFFQGYEAIRKTLLEYHQFPWWNPWVSGGVPLFANPQIGVFSIQTVLVLIFGTVIGLKLSIVVYVLVGFWGAYLLLRSNIKANVLISLLLAFCWIMNGFFVAHLFNHYTFIYFILVPLGIYLLLNISKKRYWLYSALFLSIMILGSFHYAVLQGLVIFAAVFLFQVIGNLINRQPIKPIFISILKTLCLVAVVCGARVFFTLQYVFDFSKSYPNEEINPIILLLKGLVTPGGGSNFINGDMLKGGEYGVGEYSAYIGVVMAIILVLITSILIINVIKRYRLKKQLILSVAEFKIAMLLILIVLVILAAKGVWDALSPLGIITAIPGYNNMRVPSRWLLWVGLIALVIIAVAISNKDKKSKIRPVLVGLVLVSFVELFVTGLWSARTQFTREPLAFRSNTANFIQYEDYDPTVNTEKELDAVTKKPRGKDTVNYEFEATANNIGELYGYEPLYYQSLFSTMGRCGANYGCGLLSSDNAIIVSWSPNEIKIKRKTDGPVVLNITPSSYWKLNGKRLFPGGRVIEGGQLVLYDTAEELDLKIQPQINPKTLMQTR